MPIVLSYNDVETLGALAMQTGRAQGTAARQQFDQQLLQQYDAQRNQTAVQLQGIEADQQQQAAELDFRARQADQRAGLQREAMQLDQQQFQEQQATRLQQTAMQQAGRQQESEADRQARLHQELMRQTGRAEIERLKHDLGMQQLEREAELGKYQRSGAAAEPDLGPGGMPTPGRVKQELTQHGHLIPFSSQSYIEGVETQQGSLNQLAEAIASLPTPAIVDQMRANPDDPWLPYMRAIVESREGVAPGGDVGGAADRRRVVPQGMALPEAGRTAPYQPPAQNLGGGGGASGASGASGGTGLESLSDAELMQRARQLNAADHALQNMMGAP